MIRETAVGTLVFLASIVQAESGPFPATGSSHFPLQIGNMWTYFWGYKLPAQSCSPPSSTRCIVEGAYTTHRVTSTCVVNNTTWYVVSVYQGYPGREDSAPMHYDTLRTEGSRIHAIREGREDLRIDLGLSAGSMEYTVYPSDTFVVKTVSNTMWTCPPRPGTYSCTWTTRNDTAGKYTGTMSVIKYGDSGREAWLEYYYPGAGLVYSEASEDPYSGWTCHLDTAFIAGQPLRSVAPIRSRPVGLLQGRSGPACMYDMRGRAFGGRSTLPQGIIVRVTQERGRILLSR